MNNTDLIRYYHEQEKYRIPDVTGIMPIHCIAKIAIIISRGKQPLHIPENFQSHSGNIETTTPPMISQIPAPSWE